MPENPIGWKYLWRSYCHLSEHKELWQPLLVLAPIVLCLGHSEQNMLESVHTFTGLIISIFPSLVGLVLAGYTLVVGGMNMSILSKLCKRRNDGKPSLMNDLNVTFSVAMIAGIATLVLAYVVQVLSSFELKCAAWLAGALNFLTCMALSYCALVTFRLLLSIVINVFNFGQFVNITAGQTEGKPKKYLIRFKSPDNQ